MTFCLLIYRLGHSGNRAAHSVKIINDTLQDYNESLKRNITTSTTKNPYKIIGRFIVRLSIRNK